MTQPYKQCPRCQQNAALHVPVCLRCGHQYRTQFAPPPEQTLIVAPPVGSLPLSLPRRLPVGVLGALAVALMLLSIVAGGWFLSRKNAHPLVGTWREDDRSGVGIDHTITLYPDGTYTSHQVSGFNNDQINNDAGKWYSNQEQQIGPDTFGGHLFRGGGFDYTDTVWLMNADKKHVRMFRNPEIGEDYTRQEP